ncbi:MAG: 3-deoxy-manno-octulosonate cytidylyltransferase [Candidatus Omnitrophota bacterium]|nr:3-deoxy-manno-octulosonate cytidylyltransferase [Candidatus Omnitrophota bacterium]
MSDKGRNRTVGVIPARLGSTRVPGKVLRPLAGRPMIYHVWKRVTEAKSLSDVIIACDDPSVESCAKEFGAKVVMTRQDHPNGTSRVAEVAAQIDADIVINIQGDEPFLNARNIDSLVGVLAAGPEISVATLAVRKTERAEYENPNVVKVVCTESSDAIYFSRSPIPYFRDVAPADFSFLKHLGIYGYRRDFLLEFVRWNSGQLEGWEKLEQLRIIERGIPIRVVETPYDSLGLDTEEDFTNAEFAMKNEPIEHRSL